jgi:uridine kinase
VWDIRDVDLSAHVARAIARLSAQQARVLVGIDGPDAAGKTTLADEVVRHLTVPWLRASIDGFHQPRELRVQRGALSPEGCFRDSFDCADLISGLLVPFRSGGKRVRTKVFDWRGDVPVDEMPVTVPERAVLAFDGVFLLRPELRGLWDLSVYLRVPSSIILERALIRDVGVLGSPDEVRRRYEARYLPGQALYRRECDPEGQADLVVDNSDFLNPVVVTQRSSLRH